MVKIMTTYSMREKILDEMYEPAEMYLREDNINEACRWLNLAADLGSMQANYKLGEIYRYGEGNIKPDGEKAVHYFAKEALYGSECISYINDEEDLYAEGQDTPFLYERSNLIFYGDDEVRFEIGCMYLYGDSVKKNIFKAACWFANMNSFINDIEDFFDTLFDLAECYRMGDGCERNIDKAVAWYEQIINYCDFHDKALFALAEIYFNGDGVERDIDKAAELYRRAAELRSDSFD